MFIRSGLERPPLNNYHKPLAANAFLNSIYRLPLTVGVVNKQLTRYGIAAINFTYNYNILHMLWQVRKK
jgi:hypothetical protein